MSEYETREQHLRWAKDRALAYVQRGDLRDAIGSMLSDLSKHPETRAHDAVASLGMLHVIHGDVDGVRRWIEGFN